MTKTATSKTYAADPHEPSERKEKEEARTQRKEGVDKRNKKHFLDERIGFL